MPQCIQHSVQNSKYPRFLLRKVKVDFYGLFLMFFYFVFSFPVLKTLSVHHLCMVADKKSKTLKL